MIRFSPKRCYTGVPEAAPVTGIEKRRHLEISQLILSIGIALHCLHYTAKRNKKIFISLELKSEWIILWHNGNISL